MSGGDQISKQCTVVPVWRPNDKETDDNDVPANLRDGATSHGLAKYLLLTSVNGRNIAPQKY
jgi:hypothetical protein